MKIAVASSDGANISEHFGRSACFIIFDTDGGDIVNKEVRQNSFTPHALGECNEGEKHNHQHHHTHGHQDIVGALHDCDTVICYGMGFRAAEDLRNAGINPYIIESKLTPEGAVRAFLSGRLQPAHHYCKCHEKGSAH